MSLLGVELEDVSCMLERWELTTSLKSLVVSRIPSHIKGVLNAAALGLLGRGEEIRLMLT